MLIDIDLLENYSKIIDHIKTIDFAIVLMRNLVSKMILYERLSIFLPLKLRL